MAKRILSIALALVLALGLFVPAMAVEAEVNPNAPIITRQPVAPSIMLSGNNLVLEIQAALPEGADGDISVAWYMATIAIELDSGWQSELVGTGIRIEIPASAFVSYFISSDIPMGNFVVYAVVTNTFLDEDEQTQTASIKSNEVSVTVMPRPDHAFMMLPTIFSSFFGDFTWPLFPIWIIPAIFVTLFFLPINLYVLFYNLFN